MRQASVQISLFAVLVAATVVLGAPSAAAQQPPAASPDVPALAPAPAPAPSTTEVPNVAAPAPPAPAPAPPSVAASSAPAASAPAVDDHTSVVRHWGLGYQGISTLPIGAGCCDGAGGPQLGTVNAPVIGVRYWFREAVGLDLGLGLGIQTGSAQPSAYGFAFHGGVPIVLGHGRHTAFEVIPEATVGLTTGKVAASGGIAATGGTAGGVLLRAGARAGFEVHFGFIGLPELALQATVGLYWRTEAYNFVQGDGTRLSANSTLITTSVNDNPWGIFTDTITAIYYF